MELKNGVASLDIEQVAIDGAPAYKMSREELGTYLRSQKHSRPSRCRRECRNSDFGRLASPVGL
jgi:hypothetical protein